MLPPRRRFIPPLGPPKRSARQKALATLHGIDLVPLEKMRERPASPLAALMPGVLRKIRIDKRQGEAEIARVWNSLIDPALAAHAQPVSIAHGTLFVTV
ncbi:MAG: Dna[CI] antecedent, DciA, partial [Verrucomicrobiota bacterium]